MMQTNSAFRYQRIAAAILASAIVVLALAGCSQPVTLKGTDLGKDPAPDFQLVDQSGHQVALADLRGRVVVLTFLYTHCPDVCPLIAEHLRTAAEQLGAGAEGVALVAVSIDPEHDTPDAIMAFDQQHRLNGKLIYLNGTREQLQQVWAAYYVGVQASAADPEEIGHSTRVVVIDKAGKQRANLGADFEPSDLVYNVRALLNE